MRRIATISNVLLLASTGILLGLGACTDSPTGLTSLQEEIAPPTTVRSSSPHVLGEALLPGETVEVGITVLVPPFPPLPPGSSLTLLVSPGIEWIKSVSPAFPYAVNAGDVVNFTFEVGPPDGTGDGIYDIVIRVLLLGNPVGVQTVTIVVDTTDPVITLLGSDPVNVDEGDLYTDAGATASDNIDGDITASIITDNPVDTNVPGTYTVTYNVSDAAGNPAVEVTRTVEVVGSTTTTIEVAIDIKPGSDPNSINLGSKGKGNGKTAGPNAKIAVALFSTADFDATQVDVSTVTLGDLTDPDTPVVLKNNGTYQASAEDLNDDGLLDMVFHFSRAELIANGDLTEASEQLWLTGIYGDGRDFEGMDAVRVIH